ncbi:group II intron reverse transcriptase/maturase [Geminocystis sp. CENA526]|uniref:group II intron reverse transcriptase/maturase n=1 Tax=Geminocystis sp. CENA526 TaxID=1355871 RepID=UPI003D6E58A0
MEKIDKGQPLIVTNKDIIWNDINWKIQINNVQRLRNRIFRATTELRNTLSVKRNRGQRKLPPPTKEQLVKAKSLKRKIGNLQKLLTRSLSNILVSVRKVTQVNNGKNTAGVDKILITTPEKREELIKIIQGNLRKGYTPKAILRKFIPKKNGKVRPLGIPTVYDRCIQNMVRNSLEPYWEAHFEGSSYGFRPCRSTHDAIAKIYSLARPNKTKKWIVDADIEKCFDKITHETLLDIVGNFPYRKYIEQWLKCGVMNNNTLEMSQSGTPQGGVISPLLANIALHGMEEALGIKYNNRGEIIGNRAIVRYADDFVIFCESRLDAELSIKDLKPFLSKRGLNLSEAKTNIVHITEGFDFLGYNIRQYKVNNTKTGYKCLTKPSKESIKNVKYKIKQIFKECLSKPLDLLIQKINELIRGWGNYYRNAVRKSFHILTITSSKDVFDMLKGLTRQNLRSLLNKNTGGDSNPVGMTNGSLAIKSMVTTLQSFHG